MDCSEPSASRQAAVFAAALDAIVTMDHEGRVVEFNPAAERLFGYPRREAVGQTLADLIVPPRLRADHRRGLARYLATGVGRILGQRCELPALRADGTEFPVELSVVPIPTPGPPLFVGYVRDLTERRRTEDALRRSEERFRALVEMSSDAVVVVDDAARIRYCSPPIERILGYSTDELLGRSGLELVHPDDLARAQEILARSVQSPGEHVSFLVRVRHQDGSWRWLEGICTNHLPNPAVGGLVVNYRDVSERKEAEEALEIRAKQWEDVQTLAQLGSWEWDIARNVVTWSDQLYRIFGLTRGAFVATFEEYLARVHPEDRDCTRGIIEQALRERRPFRFEERIVRPDGALRVLHSQGEVVTDAHGQPLRMMGICQDITERKRAEDERRQLEAQIQHAQKLESLGVLAGGIAHDFNNLLTGVLGFASLARMQLADESPAVPLLREIERAAQRAADLTQQMLAYSGRGRFVIQVLRLDTLVQEMAKLLGTVVSKKATLRLDLQPACVEGDATQLRQVVMNLLTNASDALEGQPGAITVRTGVRRADADFLRSPFLPEPLPAGPYAYVEVEDSGCGMSADTLARIFDPFFTTKFTGRGLGLAAILGIVKGHRGTIKVDSAPGRGTVVLVFLPCSAATVASAPTDGPREPPRRGQGLVLVVDDEASVRSFVRRVLEGVGFQVREAADGRDGLDLFRQLGPETVAVVLDLTMPRMDGTEVLRELHRDRPAVPVLVMSGYSDLEVSVRCAGMGASGFIQKPFQPHDLLARLWEVLPADRK